MSASVFVTGVAGFIGSSTAEELLKRGWRVVGVDAFTGNYERTRKEDNLLTLDGFPGFEFLECDARAPEAVAALQRCDHVLHLAGEPGVRPSWGSAFDQYLDRNVSVTQALLEALPDHCRAFVYASSSSVYGAAEAFPTDEGVTPRPISPYGVTKLAGEHLCSLYGHVYGAPTTSLRYFTVFGPRQRPDMAMQRIVEAVLDGTPFTVFGDGSARRDFTFIDDVVDANIRALEADAPPGTVVNVGGGEQGTTLSAVIEAVEEIAGAQLSVAYEPSSSGDPARTGAAVDLAREVIGWRPRTSLRDGLARHVEFERTRRGRS